MTISFECLGGVIIQQRSVILTATFMGILGLGGVARVVSATASQRIVMFPSHTNTQMAEASDRHEAAKESKVGENEANERHEMSEANERNRKMNNEAGDEPNERDREINDDKVPTSLNDVGKYGENVYDMAKVNDWTI